MKKLIKILFFIFIINILLIINQCVKATSIAIEDNFDKYISNFFIIIIEIVLFIMIVILLIYRLKYHMNKIKNSSPYPEYKEPMDKIKINKENIFNAPYCREIPYNGDLYKLYYIAYQYGILYRKTDLLGAIILKWFKENLIKISKKNIGNIIKKEEIIIILNIENKKQIKNEYELKLFNLLYKASIDGKLEEKEFQNWCKLGFSEVKSWYRSIIRQEQSWFINKGLVKIDEKEVVGFYVKKISYKDTPELLNSAKQIVGLQKYLKDYTLISNRESVEVNLFEEYLIVAQMLGIARNVAQEFNKTYPNYIGQSCFESYDNLNFIDMCLSD